MVKLATPLSGYPEIVDTEIRDYMYSNLFKPPAIASNQLHDLFRLVLKSGVKLIRKCGFTRNNQQPWVS